MLLTQAWPGNVRELKNTIERVVLLENDDMILGSHLQFLVRQPAASSRPGDQEVCISLPAEGISLEEIEKRVITEAFNRCGRNKSKTARFLKLPRHILIYRLKKLHIED